MLRQIGEKDGQVETNFFGWIVESFCEFDVVNFSIMIRITTHEQKVDFLSESVNKHKIISCNTCLKKWKANIVYYNIRRVIFALFHFFSEFSWGNPSILVDIHFLWKYACYQTLIFVNTT